ncbi:hypothetical protein ONS95_004762 [Cadophora gregata]|uniref:uncharacterized protein n=1 Tax=Cadophora gregata TaxID=51156 RepID=UPI0026DBD5B8|nr:uncharacterized protein ONS95_004762 [Cadophora gregata]KAK0104473.1 hypothetical protein ONS95_004762 [Cadophora gregata]KAK0115435.1 hypothetical protein ONS96_013891 [Cadophora gregata f. sp. sojae]
MTTQRKLETDFPVHDMISPISPLSSRTISMFGDHYAASEKYSPYSDKASPQSLLQAKPWPSRPQKLHKGLGGYRWWESTVDVIMILIPIPFFILGAAVIAVNGKVVEGRELDILQQSIKGATTLFPISFAAITGRAAVKYATWKLEQGTTLGALEQLMGSRTVASTFVTQVQLRSFNLIGLGLLFVWSLSPLGGQAILHILYTPEKFTTTEANITYFNSRQQSYSAPAGPFQNQWYPGFTVLFGSSLLAPTTVKKSSMDIWGNVKIPYYSSLSSSAPRDKDGWVQLSEANTSLVYSSLFGIPIFGLEYGNTTLNMESAYIELSCSNMSTTPILETPTKELIKTDIISTVGPFVSFENASDHTSWTIGYKGEDITAVRVSDDSTYVFPQFCPDCLPSDFANVSFPPGMIAFQEWAGFDTATSIFCTPSQVYVESTIFCDRDSGSQHCEVTAQRPSVLPHLPSEITYLSFPEVALGVSALLPNSTPSFGAVNQFQNYLYDPLSQTNIISGVNSLSSDGSPSRLQSVPLKDFGNRLGQLLNAYIYSSMWNATTYITGASFTGIENNLVGGNNASFIPASPSDLTAMIRNRTAAFTVSAAQTNESQVYFAFFPWLIVFLISNLVMLLAAIVGVYYSRRTIVPDYLGFVSSLAKESPFIRMPDVGVNMDGMDKARMVKEMKVRLGDVSDVEHGKAQVGRLAFARMEETSPVKKDRLYV